ncbi:unnamed protein product [Chilo suppressalis]|uniref:Cytoplasmic dynein 2 light intermediate chain 1 n=1 Tax=Chilo suppressalis TaxID=168631 RepID=A0ABN8BAY0_CHISP|nr:hypothetical protein evm_013740 [Chilo suppressalis]CAH0406992.1 unnamed protein product [Chilo suppressalis]
MLSIPELATQITEKTLSLLNEGNSHTLIIVGSPSVGKTTMLYSFLDKTDPPRETLVLEYSFGRKTNQKQGLEKTICHIWEYGGKLDIIKKILPSIPLKGKCYYCLMIDISKIKNVWNTIDTCITAMNETYTDSSLPELVIICGKYDLFKNYDAEIRKIICITLRSVALLLNAHLLFYSSKDAQLIKRTKDLLHYLGFGSNITSKDKNINFMKPLNIPKGVDSWESIGVPPSTFDQYTDETILLATSMDAISELFQPLEAESSNIPLRVNRAKTKMMVVDQAGKQANCFQISYECSLVRVALDRNQWKKIVRSRRNSFLRIVVIVMAYHDSQTDRER